MGDNSRWSSLDNVDRDGECAGEGLYLKRAVNKQSKLGNGKRIGEGWESSVSNVLPNDLCYTHLRFPTPLPGLRH
jgi:hypothetical protein